MRIGINYKFTILPFLNKITYVGFFLLNMGKLVFFLLFQFPPLLPNPHVINFLGINGVKSHSQSDLHFPILPLNKHGK